MQSLNIFMNKLLDYAGLFPPAKLPLYESLVNYSSYTKHKQNGWLGKFILPINKINECIEIMTKQNVFNNVENKLEFSIILNSCEKFNDLNDFIKNDLLLIKKMEKNLSTQVTIDSIELYPPKEVYQPNKVTLFSNMLEIVNEAFHSEKNITAKFIEVPFSENINEYIDLIAKYNIKNSDKIFVKLRTGGVTPEHIPSAYHIAQAIRLCAEQQIPLKATAGLHVPVPNDNPEVGARLHGFFNIFSCLLLCYSKLLTITEMEHIITDYSYSDFYFTQTGLTVGNKFISNENMSELRNSFIKSFGTCSFLEPIEHLHKNNFI